MSGYDRPNGTASCLELPLDPLQTYDPGRPVKWQSVMPILREDLP